MKVNVHLRLGMILKHVDVHVLVVRGVVVKLYYVIICLVSASNASAALLAEYSDWKEQQAFTVLSDSENTSNQYDYLFASIGNAVSGEQKIFLSYNAVKNGVYVNTCNNSEYKNIGDYKKPIYHAKQVWTINGKNIKMDVFCKKYNSDSAYYFSASASSKAGKEFIINAFKSEKRYVIISDGDFTIKMSAKGFSREWEYSGGDAI